MPDNRIILIDALQSVTLLANRYSHLRCINYDSAKQYKRGSYSLVFTAFDAIDNVQVVLKFFDPHPSQLFDSYRIQAFQREAEILSLLLGHRRCLQIRSELQHFNLPLHNPAGTGDFEVPIRYFVMEHVPSDLDTFFLRQEDYTPRDKLLLFNEIVLAVEALHEREVYHRDLKCDNLRYNIQDLKRVVIAIDLGAAARRSSTPLRPRYDEPVGAPAYAAPEAQIGMAGLRQLAPHLDSYALGCLLFELFHVDYYADARDATGGFTTALSALAAKMSKHEAIEAQFKELIQWIGAVKHMVNYPSVQSSGGYAPSPIANQLDALITRLTRLDHRERLISLPRVRSTVWSMIRCLEHEEACKRRAQSKIIERQNRERHIKDIEAKYRTRMLSSQVP